MRPLPSRVNCHVLGAVVLKQQLSISFVKSGNHRPCVPLASFGQGTFANEDTRMSLFPDRDGLLNYGTAGANLACAPQRQSHTPAPTFPF